MILNFFARIVLRAFFPLGLYKEERGDVPLPLRGKVDSFEYLPQGPQVHLHLSMRPRPPNSCSGKYTTFLLYLNIYLLLKSCSNSYCALYRLNGIPGPSGSWIGTLLLLKPWLGLGLIKGSY